jgi:MoaA/NifB/PqqE/SkfB family radical SAM enzyme
MANLGYVQVTRRCNQQCLFCSNPELPVDEDLDRGCALVDRLADEGYHGVILTGGEPTLWEPLPALIAHAEARGLPARIVTNGQRLGAEPELLGRLVEAGLRHVHLSLYSSRAEVVAELTGVPDSLSHVMSALQQLGRLRLRVATDVNTVINALNADHLDETVAVLIRDYPWVKHVVFNNLDPFMNRVADHPQTVPALWQFELSLHRALTLLQRSGRTFRVERVPLCYMAEFAWASTETRKIVKAEERTTHFLDDKGEVHQTEFLHDKASCCTVCQLDPICAGLDGVGEGFELEELYPVFVPPSQVTRHIR